MATAAPNAFELAAADWPDPDADRLPWHDDPAGFARDCVVWPYGTGLADYQADILDDVAKYGREAVRSLHGVGKTTSAALLVLWFSVTRDAAGIDWKALTTAGAWRQLERYLWPEIALWSRRLRWDLIGRDPFVGGTELLKLSLTLKYGSAFAVASSDAALIEGAHAASILYVFDESKAINADIFDAAEGAFSSPGETFALAQSTPGEPAGRFYDMHARRPGLEDWHTRHVTLAEGIAAGRVDRQWAEQRRRQWGDGSALYLNRVEGEFASSDTDSVIPLAWVEAANERWRAWEESGLDAGLVDHVGVDVARSGDDQTVIALRHGDLISELIRPPKKAQDGAGRPMNDTMETAGRTAIILRANQQARAVVDVIGLGAGVVDRLREQQEFKRRIEAFNASEHTDRKDRSGEIEFFNTRSAGWWCLRELLDPAYDSTLMLPPDDLLTGDLVAPHYAITSSGKIQVEAKDKIKERLGRSPDAGDAVMQAFWEAAPGQGQMFIEFYRGLAARDKGRTDVPAGPRGMPSMGSGTDDRPVCQCRPGVRRFFQGICTVCQGVKPESQGAAL